MTVESMFYSIVYTWIISIFVNVKVTIKAWKPIKTFSSKAVSSNVDYWSADFDANQNCKQSQRIAELKAKVRENVLRRYLGSWVGNVNFH